MNFFGKKSTKKTQGKEPPPQKEYKPYDFSAPDAFSEENMAKVRIILGNQCTLNCWMVSYGYDTAVPGMMQQELHVGFDIPPHSLVVLPFPLTARVYTVRSPC